MTPWIRRLAAGALVLALASAGCGSDDSPPEASPPEASAFPPVAAADLRSVLAGGLEPLGVHLTDRGGLIDRSVGYVQSETGTHLALYAEPVADWTVDDYLRGLVEVTAAVAPTVFQRYSELETFDICLEPVEHEGSDPPPVTQIEMTRAQVEAVDWENFDLAALTQLVETGGLDYLRATGPILELPDFPGEYP